jgi:hypothetical protein
MQLDRVITEVNFPNIKSCVQQYDSIIMTTQFKENGRYLVLSLDANHIKVLPLDRLYGSMDQDDLIQSVPIHIPFEMIVSIKPMDKLDLLFLVQTNNPHIIAALSQC